MIARRQNGSGASVAEPSGSDTSPYADPAPAIRFDDPFGHLDDHMRELVARMVRLSIAKVPHRLITRFEMQSGQLGVSVSLERKHRGVWTSQRPETWIPCVASTSAIYGLLLYVGEHGRLPDYSNASPGA